MKSAGAFTVTFGSKHEWKARQRFHRDEAERLRTLRAKRDLARKMAARSRGGAS